MSHLHPNAQRTSVHPRYRINDSWSSPHAYFDAVPANVRLSISHDYRCLLIHYVWECLIAETLFHSERLKGVKNPAATLAPGASAGERRRPFAAPSLRSGLRLRVTYSLCI